MYAGKQSSLVLLITRCLPGTHSYISRAHQVTHSSANIIYGGTHSYMYISRAHQVTHSSGNIIYGGASYARFLLQLQPVYPCTRCEFNSPLDILHRVGQVQALHPPQRLPGQGCGDPGPRLLPGMTARRRWLRRHRRSHRLSPRKRSGQTQIPLGSWTSIQLTHSSSQPQAN